MTYPFVPEPQMITAHFIDGLRHAARDESPYLRWYIKDILPESACTAILVLPIAPPLLGTTDGTRGNYNDKRTFFTPELRRQFPICEKICQALQSPEVARQFEKTCGIKADGTYLRLEYMQDLNGMWLEPHRDIKEKVFSMVVYLCTGPHAKDWGTDIYDHDKKWLKRNAPEFNSAVIFKAGPHSWHGFEPRPIIGVRRLMEINYVRDWRAREQLAFPDRPISTDPPSLPG
ncbi:MAG: 2OG-Fe(II) oxygenase [Candidatus Omnitrophica bacterium]|nr:2OG-Fe(II) oxygenase [Candidatus Omnitrophota bacterium]MDE2008680.1 2OG-Fe(II) oxygenase [Candidatus Omnitrophota bacterium]MDE2231941.1 2OG-Fe(II) oxygenase [Candidatus Omnitrophota bacterium]